MKVLVKTVIALATISISSLSFAQAVQFHQGQRLTAQELNQIATQANHVNEALGLAKDGNALVASPKLSLNQTITAANQKAQANCQQKVCTTTIYLVPNQTYIINSAVLSIPAQTHIVTLGKSTATITLNNARLSLGQQISLNNVNLQTNHQSMTNQQLKAAKATLTHVTYTS